MKKINSIGYAHMIIGLAALFLIGIPLFLYILKLIIHVLSFQTLIYTSFAIGLLIVLFFAGLLLIEFFQDKKCDRQYANIKKKRMSLRNGIFECQTCGSRQVVGTNKSCNVCGTQFT